ncbi:MAG: hypothetical protein ACXWPM_06135 [Bdellovibrionota bacterium]
MTIFVSRHTLPAMDLKLIALLSLLVATAASAADSLAWKTTKTAWSASDERGFGKWIHDLGYAGCKSIDECIKSPTNPFHNSDPQDTDWFSDCADLPYFLRAYFAWKNGLPFGYVSEVEAVPVPGPSSEPSPDPSASPSPEPTPDIRYSLEGNYPTARSTVIARAAGNFPNALQAINRMENITDSSMFRYNPKIDDEDNFPDFYSVKITRDSIAPGTIIYDPNGHVAVVYDVLSDGRILYIDAHPDNSLTHGTYGMKFERSRPGMGAGFKKWRPVTLVGAKSDGQGNFYGGHLAEVPNERIPDFGTEQYYGTKPDPDGAWQRGKFFFAGKPVGYYDYVRMALAVGNLQYHPIDELRNMLTALCQDTRDRADSVTVAIAAHVDQKQHPDTLPDNIYGTSGEWETYSTPSRDARLKTSFKEARDRTQEFVEKFRAHDPSVVYSGTDLKGDLLGVFEETTKACQIHYKSSLGDVRTLTLENVMNRIYAISFDPYDCVEHRWGASGVELATCVQKDSTKPRWYVGEQWLRNQLERTYDVKMGFTLEELEAHVPGSGVPQGPDVDLRRYLESL